MSRAVMQQALDEMLANRCLWEEKEKAVRLLQAALAEPEQEPISLCERVERRLKDVNTAAMKLTHDLVCMECDNDDRLDRDRVMERIMQWRNEWDKAMHIPLYTAPPQRKPLSEHEPISLNDGRLTMYPGGSIGVGTPSGIEAAPTPRKPLSLDEIQPCADEAGLTMTKRLRCFARAVERAHGITGEQT